MKCYSFVDNYQHQCDGSTLRGSTCQIQIAGVHVHRNDAQHMIIKLASQSPLPHMFSILTSAVAQNLYIISSRQFLLSLLYRLNNLKDNKHQN